MSVVDGIVAAGARGGEGRDVENRAPIKLFERRYYVRRNSGRTYDVSPDGQRFLMIKGPGTDAPPALILVQHWDAELKRLCRRSNGRPTLLLPCRQVSRESGLAAGSCENLRFP